MFKQIRGVQRHPLSAFAVFQVLSAQNNQDTEVAYFGAACLKLLQLYFGLTCSVTPQPPP